MYDLPKLDLVLTADDFQPHLGKMFLADANPEPIAIQLTQIVRSAGPPLLLRAPFSLFFRSPPEVLLMDGIYRMRCGRFGPHEIALTPILSPPSERRYQAVFT